MGDFRIIQLIGQGGCGAVFEALQERLEREVALKVVLPEIAARVPGVAQRFMREIDLVKRLEHPNIVRLYDFGQSDQGLLWMAMELVRGPELKNVIDEAGAMPPKRALKIALQVLSGLAEAHSHKIIHRDLKPSNIMLTKKGADQDVVKLLDFGIGKALGEFENQDLHDLTGSFGDAFGTPRYTAPELLKNEGVGPHSDIYTFGLILFEMLTGRPAVDADTVYGCLARQISEELVLPEWLADSPFGPILMKATRKDWSQRFDSALAFHAALSEVDTRDIKPPGDTTSVGLASVDTGKLSALKTGKTSLKDISSGTFESPLLKKLKERVEEKRKSGSHPKLSRLKSGAFDIPSKKKDGKEGKGAPSSLRAKLDRLKSGAFPMPTLQDRDDAAAEEAAAEAEEAAAEEAAAEAEEARAKEAADTSTPPLPPKRKRATPPLPNAASASGRKKAEEEDADEVLPEWSPPTDDDSATRVHPIADLRKMAAGPGGARDLETLFDDDDDEELDPPTQVRRGADVFVFVKRGAQSSLCQALDVQLEGAMLTQVDPPLAIDDVIELELEPADREPFEAQATVVEVIEASGVVHVTFDDADALYDQLLPIVSDERRRGKRLAVDIPVIVTFEDIRVLTHARDMSRGGMRLVLVAELRGHIGPLDALEVEFGLTVDEVVHDFALDAKVLREHDGHFGVEFINISSADADIISAFIETPGAVATIGASTPEEDDDSPSFILPRPDQFLTSSSTPRLLLIAGVLLVAVILLAVIVLSGGEDDAATPPASASEASTAEPPPVEDPVQPADETTPDENGSAQATPEPTPPEPTPPEPPPAPTEVTWALQSNPVGAIVKRGEAVLCEATPCSLTFPISEEPIALAFSLDKHDPAEKTFVPSKDGTLDVSLIASPKPVKKVTRKKKKKKKADPFSINTD